MISSYFDLKNVKLIEINLRINSQLCECGKLTDELSCVYTVRELFKGKTKHRTDRFKVLVTSWESELGMISVGSPRLQPNGLPHEENWKQIRTQYPTIGQELEYHIFSRSPPLT